MPVFYTVATIWALVGAWVRLREALRQRSRESVETIDSSSSQERIKC